VEVLTFYDNIKIELLESKPIFLKFEMRSFQDWTRNSVSNEKRLTLSYDEKAGDIEAVVPMIKFTYSKGYTDTSKYFFNYCMTILVRMLSYNELFTNPFFHPTGNKMRYLIGVNNKNTGYRSFSEEKISSGGLKTFDDIERVNERAEKLLGIGARQTDFYSIISSGKAVKDRNVQKKYKTYKERMKKKAEMKKKIAEDNLKMKERVKEIKMAAQCNCKLCKSVRGEI
jgi:hypothetical protein